MFFNAEALIFTASHKIRQAPISPLTNARKPRTQRQNGWRAVEDGIERRTCAPSANRCISLHLAASARCTLLRLLQLVEYSLKTKTYVLLGVKSGRGGWGRVVVPPRAIFHFRMLCWCVSIGTSHRRSTRIRARLRTVFLSRMELGP